MTFTESELWDAYESCRKSQSTNPASFADLCPFLFNQQVQVPVAYFLKRIFDKWENIGPDALQWFMSQLSNPSQYSGFLLEILSNSLKTNSDIISWKSQNDSYSLLNYLQTDYHKQATEILFRISLLDSGYLTSEEALNQIIHFMNQNNTLKIRCFDLVIRVACVSNEHLSKILDSTLIRSWINGFKSSDLLVVLNVIEMAAEMAQLENGVYFLEKTDVFVELNTIFQGDCHSTDDYLKVCAVIKFWSSLVLLKNVDLKSILSSFQILDRLNEIFCISGREELKIHSITMLGNLGSHKIGLEIILKHSLILDTFANVYKEATNQLKSTCMQSLSCLLDRESPLEIDDSKRCKIVYDLFPTCLYDIQNYWKSPFDEIRYNAYALLKGIVSHPWGIPIIANNELFYLLINRSTESSLIGKNWRLSIIKTILSHDCTQECMIQSAYQKLSDYVKQGLNYSSIGPIVSMESG